MLIVRVDEFGPRLPAMPVFEPENDLANSYSLLSFNRIIITFQGFTYRPTSASSCGSSSNWYLSRYAFNSSVPSTYE